MVDLYFSKYNSIELYIQNQIFLNAILNQLIFFLAKLKVYFKLFLKKSDNLFHSNPSGKKKHEVKLKFNILPISFIKHYLILSSI